MADSERFPPGLPVLAEQSVHAEGRAWLERLPGLVEDAAARWDLELGTPFMGGTAAWAGPARRRDGLDCVLKVTLPHREARYEGEGLRVWDGAGTVHLLAEHEGDYALLIERCLPGTTLAAEAAPAEERLIVAAELLRRLWDRPVPADAPFESVADVCAEWAGLVRHRMATLRPAIDDALVEVGAGLLETLPPSASRSVLVHGDYNPTNILRAERETWLAIDVKPMVGDPAYDPSPLVLQVGEPVARADLLPRFALVADVVGEPVERLLAWTVARNVEAALWNSSRGEDPQPAMAEARVFADLLGA